MKFAGIIVIAILLTSGCATIHPTSIVQISVLGEKATGFFIEPTQIITVAHWTHDITDGFQVSYLSMTGMNITTDVFPIVINIDLDMIILGTNLDGQPVKWCERGEVGDIVKIWGRRDGVIVPERGMILSRYGDIYITSTDTTPGYSGAPVTLGDCVLAMHIGRTEDGASFERRPILEGITY